MSITRIVLPTSTTLTETPFQSEDGFPNDNSFPNMRELRIPVPVQAFFWTGLTVSAPIFSAIPSIFGSVLNAQPRGLSTGATVGISIGAVVAGILLIAIVILLWRRRHKAKQSGRYNSGEKAPLPEESRLGNRIPESRSKPGEIDGGGVHEVDVPHRKLNEADNMNTRVELDSGWGGWEAPALLETEISRRPPDLPQVAGDGQVLSRELRNNRFTRNDVR